MNWKDEWKPLLYIIGIFLVLFFLPLGWSRFDNSIMEALHLAKWYAREHVLLCLVPAFFIAGAIAVFISESSVMKYLGPAANKVIAYGVSSVSGSVLAVCSCTVLPLFAGIYRMGAGLGPASAFLYSGPAINVLAIILTANVLGFELGVARAVGAILFSIVIGLLMHVIYRKEEAAKASTMMHMPEPQVSRPLWQNAVYFFLMIAILVFANWGKPSEYNIQLKEGKTITGALLKGGEGHDTGTSYSVKILTGEQKDSIISVNKTDALSMTPVRGFFSVTWQYKWHITAIFSIAFALILIILLKIAWWKMLLIAVPTAALGFIFSENPLIAFTAGSIGLSVITGTGKGEEREWFTETWGFAKQILPLLLFGVLIAGLLLGRPGHEGLVPSQWISGAVGGNSIGANLFASVAGAFMYFATLTEIPILQGLMGAGMGKGPALSLLLAGPALSLPNMLVIRSVVGTKKTVVFVSLVIIMSTISGLIYGTFF